MSSGQEELVPDFVIRHLLHSALSQVGLPNTQVSRDAVKMLDHQTREFVRVVTLMAQDIARQRRTTVTEASPMGERDSTSSLAILEEDVWQAIHRLGLNDHLGVQPPAPLPSIAVNRWLSEDGSSI